MTAAASTVPVALERRDRTDALAATAVALTVAAAGAAHGSYFPPAWGWLGIGLAWVAAVALVLGAPPQLTRLRLAYLGGFAALAVWYGLSALWSESATSSLLESQRALVYPLAALVVLVTAKESRVPALVSGLAFGIAGLCAYGLATRFFAERLGGTADAVVGTRLATPLGYWNALGIFAALGALLAFGLAARGRSTRLRAAAAAALVVIAPALYLTFSRGAWLALAAGAVTALAIDRHRLQLAAVLLVASVAPAVAVAATSRSRFPSLAAPDGASTLGEGRRLAALIVALAVGSALALAGLARVEERIAAPAALRRVAALAGVALAVAAVAVVSIRFGSPPALFADARRAFDAPPPTVRDNLNGRLFNLSGSGRSEQFAVAWREFLGHPLVGTGAGTYERHWLLERPLGSWKIRDAHSLYLETLGELGLVGFALLACALAPPLAALGRARRHPLASTLAGAYVAYLVHAGFDWDWEMTVVTLVAVACGAALTTLASEPAAAARGAGRLALACAATAAGVVALVGLIGNTAIARSHRAVQDGRWAQAVADARTAARWAPWSSEPLLWRGEADVGQNRLAAARRELTAAIAKDRGSWELWFDLALASARGGSAQRHALANALRLDPLSPEVHEFMRSVGLSIPRVRGS